ncbi:MBL fold metallo-hydrolase [Maledivibacter halophilus]|uniref:7,8-dihydropterin-6-yl-methyl-4-(Beta-D-ribofuranosyl)aminobenzene 5'-phosphate synthase n=1 Tax=Maledivibacter halophilus TaxID=36842 RepID=A0A1T5LC75_9FIRM|nr:MBL fold metallo-hydrolase [Maledivibacter halophilus]SKC73646.1 7,8-dihydropterin-6-yl-methyl-4-(beta-D-ribofuranosyl)aminobenzene 5'-phosphate synthase [Maledivibacter halophilus]
MKLHILMDNYVTYRKLLAEHGLSFFIEANNKKIVFDTGQSNAFINNAKALGLNLSEVENIILSHGHYDHSGGLEDLTKLNKKARIYMHPCVLKKKFSLNKGILKDAGIPFEFKDIGLSEERIKFNTGPLNIYDNILISGEIEKNNDFETIPKNLIIKENGELKQDNMIDEQFLIVREKRGIIIVLGCSHPGVVNCIEYASTLIPEKKILAVIGGMHLKNASEERINKTIEYFKSKDIEKIIPLHCTGFEAISKFKRVFKDKCIIGSVGKLLEII